MNRFIILKKIIELGSFTKAAEELGYTQSAVSQAVVSLESELSLTLLRRSRTGVRLTGEGEELYPFIERTVLQYLAMREKAKEITGLAAGIVKVGTMSSVTCHWMPKLIKGFQELYPNVRFLFHQGDYTSIQEWIKNGAVDFGFVTPAAVSGLETAVIKEGEMLAVLPTDHPLAAREKVALSELAGEPFILLEEGYYSEPLNAFTAAGITPDIKYTIHDDYAIMTMVEAGLGVSILAELVLRRNSFGIVSLPIDPPLFRTLALGYKDKASLPIAAKYFIRYILENKDHLE